MRRRIIARAALATVCAATLVVGGSLAARGAVNDAIPAVAGTSSIGSALASQKVEWGAGTRVDHVRIVGTGSDWVAEISFDDGSGLELQPSVAGIIDTVFPERSATSAVVSVIGSDARIASAVFDLAPKATTVTVSSSSDRVAALSDGDVAAGRTGAEWTAATSDAAPWVQWTFPEARLLASVQVMGPSATFIDPAARGSAAMNGTLVFSDGSRVPVSGIGGGMDAPTTLAFAPRSATWVRLELAKTIPMTVIGLREAAVYDAATTPPRWPTSSGVGYTATPPSSAGCAVSSAAVGSSSDGSPALVCPAIGSRVSGMSTVVVQVAAGATATAAAWVPAADGRSGAIATIATAVGDSTGRAVLGFDAAALRHGPFALRITTPASTRALYAQLDNGGGIQVTTSGSTPAGMTLRFAEEFTKPLSASDRGVGTEYMTKKVDVNGGTEFGSAQFAAPERTPGTLATIDQDYLRLRLQPFSPGEVDRSGWGRTTDGGLLASARIGGTGFSAQYGYFEARILGAPGKGTWPAFWAMSTEASTPRSITSGEADTVELYGHDTTGTCRTTHNWTTGSGSSGGQTDCRGLAGFDDWALAWHTYGVRVTPTATEYYVDGVKVATHNAMRQNSEPFYFMLDLAAGGGWPVDLAPTGGVSDMYVDWVHVYT